MSYPVKAFKHGATRAHRLRYHQDMYEDGGGSRLIKEISVQGRQARTTSELVGSVYGWSPMYVMYSIMRLSENPGKKNRGTAAYLPARVGSATIIDFSELQHATWTTRAFQRERRVSMLVVIMPAWGGVGDTKFPLSRIAQFDLRSMYCNKASNTSRRFHGRRSTSSPTRRYSRYNPSNDNISAPSEKRVVYGQTVIYMLGETNASIAR
jgi:hypothetical protein